jgi:hypothetical protein
MTLGCCAHGEPAHKITPPTPCDSASCCCCCSSTALHSILRLTALLQGAGTCVSLQVAGRRAAAEILLAHCIISTSSRTTPQGSCSALVNSTDGHLSACINNVFHVNYQRTKDPCPDDYLLHNRIAGRGTVATRHLPTSTMFVRDSRFCRKCLHCGRGVCKVRGSSTGSVRQQHCQKRVSCRCLI